MAASNHINTNEDFKSSSSCKILSEEELVDIELDWIGGLKEQLEFLNAAMKHHCISLKVQKREFVIGGTP